MNGTDEVQFHLDFLTGRPTFIYGEHISDRERAACAALNRQRARGIQEATRPAAPGESIPPDGWIALVAARASQWSIPLIPLPSLGMSFDEDGFILSTTLKRIGSGAEATAWIDGQHRCVYKLFDLKTEGALGKKLSFELERSQEYRVVPCDAYLKDTLEKLCLLHEVGACPTEIVGLAESGDYLIAKQPFCELYEELEADRRVAVEAIQAVVPTGSFGATIWVFWAENQPWCLSDLHKGNIRRDVANKPTIIDALVGPIPPQVAKSIPALERAVNRSRVWRETGVLPTDNLFHGVSDDEL